MDWIITQGYSATNAFVISQGYGPGGSTPVVEPVKIIATVTSVRYTKTVEKD